MDRRRKWFLRPGKVAVDLVGQVVPDGDVPRRWRGPGAADGVPDGLVTSRCDGAVVYERPERWRAAPTRGQRVYRDDLRPSGERPDRQRRGSGVAEGRGSDG
ncbi:hypothetical protein GA0074695_3892 [Micromonospora viridifaciens]|uniref:Uncharacterized protein n=1 Tax=Micromonospora viridifaciens TaxID=1881 RepID=A0A1C4Y761_MICVI|nr:hypothetical protein GA0074695_3892 [Micromonospora viridifaciens]